MTSDFVALVDKDFEQILDLTISLYPARIQSRSSLASSPRTKQRQPSSSSIDSISAAFSFSFSRCGCPCDRATILLLSQIGQS